MIHSENQISAVRKLHSTDARGCPDTICFEKEVATMKKQLFVTVIMMVMIFLASAALAENTATIELSVEYDYDAAERLLGILNAYRESGDAWVLDQQENKVQLGVLPALVLDETLTDAAMQRASELTVSFSHTRPDGSLCFSVNSAVLGENIAIYYTSPEAAYTAFAEEQQSYLYQGHRRNMLDSDYLYVGIGAVRYNGQLYWAMDFSNRAPNVEAVPERRTNETPAVIEINYDSPEL